MKSGKQRREEIKSKRKQTRSETAIARDRAAARRRVRLELHLSTKTLLAPYKSYGAPDYVMRGYYQDVPFRCQGCGKEEIWTAAQQKWWYEVAKGYVYSTAKLCRPCRKKEQARRAEARRIHLEGVARKKAARRGG